MIDPAQARLAEALAALDRHAAMPVAYLDAPSCSSLIEAAETLAYRRARPQAGDGPRPVTQDFEICMDIPDAHPLWGLCRQVEADINRALLLLDDAPLDPPIALNDLVAQRYAPGSAGISAHRDHIKYVGIVVLAILGGDGRFTLSADREGHGSRVLEAGPGDLVLMRAPGFAGRGDRPFHSLDRVTATRHSIGMRSDLRKPPFTGGFPGGD